MSIGSDSRRRAHALTNGKSSTHPRSRLWSHRVDRRNHCVVLRVQGELDAAAHPEFSVLLEEAMRTPCDAVVLDLRETSFLSVRAALELGTAREFARSHGVDLRIVAGRREVERALQVTGMRSAFRRYSSMRAALDA